MGSHTIAIKDVNIFFWIFIAVLLLFLFRIYVVPRLLLRYTPVLPSFLRFLLQPQMVKLLGVATGVMFLAATFFEVYYVQGTCSVSSKYYQINKENAVKVIDFLNKHKKQFWNDGASLLNVLRNEEINAWDHDVDFAMLHPGDEALNELVHLLKKTHPELNVEYIKERGLLQIFPPGFTKGPHTDILMWREEESNGEKVLVSDEYTLRVKSHKKDDIFPLKEAKWLDGRTIYIPVKSHELCLAEYGSSYMQPIYFRLDCLENIIHGRTFL